MRRNVNTCCSTAKGERLFLVFAFLVFIFLVSFWGSYNYAHEKEAVVLEDISGDLEFDDESCSTYSVLAH